MITLPLLLLLTLSSQVQSAVLRFNGGTPSWNYMSRFCFRPNSPSSKSTSKLTIIHPNFVQRAQSNMTVSDIPIYLAAYWDDPTSQEICNNRLNCYESVYAKDLWTNVYHGVPSSSESTPSCSWRLGVAEKRGNLISLSAFNLENITSPSSHMSPIASVPGLTDLAQTITAREIPYLGKSIREYYLALASCFPKNICDDDNNGCEYSLTGLSILLVLENSYDNESYKHLSSDDYEVMNCCIWAVSITALLSVLAVKSVSAHYHYHTLHWLHASLIMVIVCLFISYAGSAKYFSDFGEVGLGKKREQAHMFIFVTTLGHPMLTPNVFFTLFLC